MRRQTRWIDIGNLVIPEIQLIAPRAQPVVLVDEGAGPVSEWRARIRSAETLLVVDPSRVANPSEPPLSHRHRRGSR
jgi:hypothetical protein